MGVQVSYPGVYIEEFAPGAPIEGVGTSTAAFVGVAKKGPILEPTLIQSWDAFVEIFGGFIDTPFTGYLDKAVFGFFLNGGTTCYVLRVGTGVQASATLKSREATPKDLISAQAREEGPVGNGITVDVTDSSVVTSLLKASGSTATALVPAFAETAVTAFAAPATLTVGDVSGFVVGDLAKLEKGASSDFFTITAIDAAAKKLTVAKAVTAPLNTAGTKAFLWNLTKGRRRFRVKPEAFGLAEALPTGTTINIKKGATEETAVVESTGGDTVDLQAPLTKDFDQSAGTARPQILSQEFTLRVDSGGVIEEFADLGPHPSHPRYWRTTVESAAITLTESDPPPVVADRRPQATLSALSGGTADNRFAAWSAFEGSPVAALDKLRPVDEISIVAVPGSTATLVQQAVRDHCESTADRFGILDSVTGTKSQIADLKIQFAGVRSARGYVALYYPWITAAHPLTGAIERMPPSGHLAGVFARTDASRGVHKAPANTNIRGAIGLEHKLTDEQQGPLNLSGNNNLRVFPAESQPLVWGARTTATDRNWQYVNIRRLFLYLEESIQEGIRWALFEPNNLQLWQKLNRTITEFLTRVWKDGALFGETPKDAFYVRIDEALNPPSERALGRLTIEIGVKPSYPAEFIIVRIGIWQGGSAVSEA
jgi:phage tail sheath protein FI